MEQKNKNIQRMSVYFPLALLERVRTSARVHRRSFNQEALWLIEQGLEQQEGEQRKDAQEL
jgi:Arc-like DNA binding domain